MAWAERTKEKAGGEQWAKKACVILWFYAVFFLVVIVCDVRVCVDDEQHNAGDSEWPETRSLLRGERRTTGAHRRQAAGRCSGRCAPAVDCLAVFAGGGLCALLSGRGFHIWESGNGGPSPR